MKRSGGGGGGGIGDAIDPLNGVSEEQLLTVDIEDVQCGDLCKVLPGTGIPTDGVIRAGSSFVDESMITGRYAIHWLPCAGEIRSVHRLSSIQASPFLSSSLRGIGSSGLLSIRTTAYTWK